MRTDATCTGSRSVPGKAQRGSCPTPCSKSPRCDLLLALICNISIVDDEDVASASGAVLTHAGHLLGREKVSVQQIVSLTIFRLTHGTKKSTRRTPQHRKRTQGITFCR